MDIRMPGMDGIAATAAICAPHLARVLMLTTYDLDEYVYDALRAGASGFLLKTMRRQDLVEAVRVVAAGDALLAPTVTRRLIADLVARQPARFARSPGRHSGRWPGSAGGRPTPCASWPADCPMRRLPRELFVTEHTVKTHVSNLLAKLGSARPGPGRGAGLRVRPGRGRAPRLTLRSERRIHAHRRSAARRPRRASRRPICTPTRRNRCSPP